MEFKIGYGFQNIKKDYIKVWGRKIYDETKFLIDLNPNYLITMFSNKEIIGWAIWHESDVMNHRKDYSRDVLDSEILIKLIGMKKDFIELHELWIMEKFRGFKYGTQFFAFFEDFVKKQKYNFIIYYADHKAAIEICRKRGYKELYNSELKWYTFYKLV